MSGSEDLRWHVCYTGSREEELANSNLMMAGFETLLLRKWKKITHARKEEWVKRPLYPRYLFVGIAADQSMYGVREARGVSAVLYSGDKPHRLPNTALEAMRRLAGPGDVVGGKETVVVEPIFAPGDDIRITEGLFSGFVAVVMLDNGRSVDLVLTDSGKKISIPACDLVAVLIE